MNATTNATTTDARTYVCGDCGREVTRDQYSAAYDQCKPCRKLDVAVDRLTERAEQLTADLADAVSGLDENAEDGDWTDRMRSVVSARRKLVKARAALETAESARDR